MMFHKKVIVLSTSLVILSPMIIMPLSTIIPSDVAVVMHDDDSVMKSVNVMQLYDSDLLVVNYNSLEYALMIHRIVGTVVWTSHGGEDGILAGNQVLSWSDFSSLRGTTKGMDVVLACESSRVYDFIGMDKVLAFSGAVDAVLGGLFVAWLLTGNQDMLQGAANRTMALRDGVVNSDNLYWSPMEQAWFGIDAAIFMVSALSSSFAAWKATLSPQSTIAVFAAALQFLSVFLGFTVFMAGACSGTLSPLTVATKLLTTFAQVVAAILYCTPWYVQLLSVPEAVITGPSRLVTLVLMIVGLFFLVNNMLNDQADPDGVYGRVFVGM